jgi:outer membrane protein TolC
MRRNARPAVTALACIGAAALLGACAHGPSPDAKPAYESIDRLTQPQLGTALPAPPADDAAQERARNARVAALLAAPLDADGAVELALLNHRGLQARLVDAAITQADLAQAARWPNPGFGFARIRGDGEVEYERGLHWAIARLLTRPWRVRAEQQRAQAEQRQLAAEVLAHAFDVRRAWLQAVAAEQALAYRRQVRDAAEAAAELARRMQQAGNWSRLERLREHAFYSDAALALQQAELQRAATRERLARLLGLWGPQTAFSLPSKLPELPTALRPQDAIEQLALEQRLDIQVARLRLQQQAESLGLVRATRFVDVLELSLAQHDASPGGHAKRGYDVRLELPLFDSGDARLARAEAQYRQALLSAAALAVDARSQVREAYARYLSAYDVARHHRDERVPLAQRIGDEQLLRYNAMLIGVFELLADARAQIVAVAAALDATRDFWLADLDLQQALVGPAALPTTTPPPAPAAAAAADRH